MTRSRTPIWFEARHEAAATPDRMEETAAIPSRSLSGNGNGSGSGSGSNASSGNASSGSSGSSGSSMGWALPVHGRTRWRAA